MLIEKARDLRDPTKYILRIHRIALNDCNFTISWI